MTPPFQITNNILALTASISEILGRLNESLDESFDESFDEKKLKNVPLKLRKKNQIKTIQGTLAIEGNSLTHKQMTMILEGKKVRGDFREIIEVKNTISLYQNLDTYKPFSERDFLKAHKVLMMELLDSVGKYRNKNVGILKGTKVSHLAPSPKLVPELMKNLFNWAKKQKDLHPLIKSSIFHYEIEFIHPFEDGNGRMGRFMQTLTLANFMPLFKNLPIESLIFEHQKTYYKALELSDQSGESTPFIEFMLNMILKALRDYVKELK